MTEDYHRRLLDRVRLKLDPKGTRRRSSCWHWPGQRNKQGYGLLWSRDAPGKKVLAHRLAYEAFLGPLPPNACVLHTCDTPSCCNPSHLYSGSRTENARDRVQRGRTVMGEQHGASFLTDNDVRELRRRYEKGEPLASIARGMGLSYRHAWKIAKRLSWRHV